MTLLSDRWSGLAALQRVELADLPTRVAPLRAASEATRRQLWVKRDDLTSTTYGGNKVRKLEFLIGDALAKKCDTIITTGAAGSHHVLATTLFARQHGLAVHAVLCPQPWTPHVEENLRCGLAAGAVVHPVRRFGSVGPKMLTVAARLRMRGRKPYLVGPGGSSPVGALGYVEAGLELARQIDERVLPEPSTIYLALGSSGTAAGTAVGLAACGLTSRLVAVRVTDAVLTNRAALSLLVRRTVRLLRKHDARFPDVADLALGNLHIDTAQLGEGYGRTTEASLAATELAARDGLVVDPTYTAKAYAAAVAKDPGADPLQRASMVGPSLYWHTLSSANLAPLLAAAPPVDEGIARRLGRKTA